MKRRPHRRRLLCLSTYPRDDASVRQRFLAYVPEFERRGWRVDFESVISDRLFEIKNRDGVRAGLEKVLRLVAGLLRRVVVLALARRYDAIWIQREAFPFLTPAAERLLRRWSGARLVVDLDDALYEAPPGGGDWRSRLRHPDGYAGVVRSADAVVVGSPVLAAWASLHQQVVEEVPTCVDTERVRPSDRRSNGVVTVGWIGSWSTTRSLLDVADALRAIAAIEGVRLLFIGAANLAEVQAVVPQATWRTWRGERELDDLQEFDIGLMPLADTPWNRGKCAYKLIQYMAAAIPFVASPVGMNVPLVAASGAGILCQTESAWVDAVRELASDPGLREQLGAAGRRYAVEHFDHRRHVDRLVAILEPGP